MGFKLKNVFRVITAPVTVPLSIASKAAEKVADVAGLQNVPIVGSTISNVTNTLRTPDDLVRATAGFEGQDSRIGSDRISADLRSSAIVGGTVLGGAVLAPAIGVTSTLGTFGVGTLTGNLFSGKGVDSGDILGVAGESFGLDPSLFGYFNAGGTTGDAPKQAFEQGYFPEAGQAAYPRQTTQLVKPAQQNLLPLFILAAGLVILIRRK